MKYFPRLLVLAATVATAGCGSGDGKARGSLMTRMFGPSPEQLVEQMLKSPDADLRRQAVEKLSGKGRGRREPYLTYYAAMTGDPAATVRSAALRALGRSGNVKYVKVVAASLKDPDAIVRWDAAVALDRLVDLAAGAGKAGDLAVKILSEAATTDDSVDVRAAAAGALRHYQRRQTLATLLVCLQDPAYGVRFRASEALRELTGENAGPEADEWQRVLAAKADPFAKPPKAKRPWWDWFGVTNKKRPTSQPARANRSS